MPDIRNNRTWWNKSLQIMLFAADHLIRFPWRLLVFGRQKINGLRQSIRLGQSRLPLIVDPVIVQSLFEQLQTQQQTDLKAAAGVEKKKVIFHERSIVSKILEETSRLNRNNVTRTAAYWTMYQSHPELQWALLAHVVSRNGGWCMTDLQGELLPELISGESRDRLFQMLECCNAAIFADAYPQLLLYCESRKSGDSLFHLLPAFHVSRFMEPFWQQFWRSGNIPELTIALVINEQHCIEEQVLTRGEFRQAVLDSLLFRSQSLLQLNQIIVPYQNRHEIRLAGLVLEQFSDLNERIRFGIQLYAMLFSKPDLLQAVLAFVGSQPHSGSRADYWPKIFARKIHVRSSSHSLQAAVEERLIGSRLRAGAAPFFSPELAHVWPDMPFNLPQPTDWLRSEHDLSALLDYFSQLKAPFSCDMTHAACVALNTIELAAAAKRSMSGTLAD